MSIAILLFVAFTVLFMLGTPIAVAIGGASILTLSLTGKVALVSIVQRIFASTNSFVLMAIPFFMLTGAIMDRAGITVKLVNLCKASLGWMRCGMCYVTALAGILMGGISGSAAADTAALASVLVPPMEKTGYPRPFLVPLLASAGSIGIIIPPSLSMIVVGSVTNISVSRLFLAGIIPGVIVGIMLMICSYIICKRNGWGAEDIHPFSPKEFLRAFADAGLSLLAPVIVIGGIVTGAFTPTEASVISAVYCLFLGVFVYRTIRLNNLLSIFGEAMTSTAVVMFVVGCSACFSWILTRYNFPKLLGTLILGFSADPAFIFFVIFIAFTIGGMFIDGTPLVIMLAPILYPIATDAGIHPLVFGIFIVINVAVGGVSPPVGTPLFVACAATNTRIEQTVRYVIPFLISMAVVGFFVAAVPWLCTLIPGL